MGHSLTPQDNAVFEGPLTFAGTAVSTDPERFGELVDRSDLLSDPLSLRETYVREGHALLRGLLDPSVVLAARRELLLKYAVVGEIDDRHPLMDAVAGDSSGLAGANVRALTQSLRTGGRYEAVIGDPTLVDTIGLLLGDDAVPFDFRWPRLARPGEGCGFHCDGPYMNRGTDRHLSTWIPLGRVTPRDGALMLLEGSHRNETLRSGYLQMDADRDGLVWLPDDPAEVQDRYGARWLTTTFEPGDVLVFSMDLLHGALDNANPDGRCRLSTDSRYYAQGETPDPRWNGAPSEQLEPHGPGRVFYPGLGNWDNADFQDEWKYVDDRGRLRLQS